MEFVLTNSSRMHAEEGQPPHWQCTAFIQAQQPSMISQVLFVEYHLPTAMKNPVRRVFTANGGFPLEVDAWKPYEVKARVVYKPETNRKPTKLSSTLQLQRKVAAGVRA